MKLRSLSTKPFKRRLAEAETKTADTTDIDWDNVFDDPVSKGDVAPMPGPRSKPKTKEMPKLRKGSAQDTAAAMRNVRMSPAASQKLAGLNIPDDALAAEPDLDMPRLNATTVGQQPITPDNVPAVITNALKTNSSELGDISSINPTWHQVKNLPGYMSKQIRVLGRETFKPFTTTPIEDITVIANLGGQGPNSNREIQAVANWLKENGQQIDDASMDYAATMPGYTAETISYTASGVRFLLVLDQMGQYIYAWPEHDSVKQITQAPQQKRLK